MTTEPQNKSDIALAIAIELVKSVTEAKKIQEGSTAEEKKEKKEDSSGNNALLAILNKITSQLPLSLAELDTLILTLSRFSFEPKTLQSSDVRLLIQLLNEIWMNARKLPLNLKLPGLTSRLESLGELILDKLATILSILPSMLKSWSYPKEFSRIERGLFTLFGLLTSPIKYMEKAIKCNTKEKIIKLDKEKLLKLFPAPEIPKTTTDKIASTAPSKPESQPPLVNIPQAANSETIESMIDENRRATELMKNEGIGAIGTILSEDMLKIMSTLASHGLKTESLWIKYFTALLSYFTSPDLKQDWSADPWKSGWVSFNTAILVLEIFPENGKGKSERSPLISSFLNYANSALMGLHELGKTCDTQEKAENLVSLYSAHVFQLFMFLSYISKTSPEISLAGAQLATNTVLGIIEGSKGFASKLNKDQLDNYLSSLYFIFSYMCKQVNNFIRGDGKKSGGLPSELIKSCNYLLVGCKCCNFLNCLINKIPIPSDNSAEVPVPPSTSINNQETYKKKGGASWEIPAETTKNLEEAKTKISKKIHAASRKAGTKSKGAPKQSKEKNLEEKKDSELIDDGTQSFQGAYDSLEELITMMANIYTHEQTVAYLNICVTPEYLEEFFRFILSQPVRQDSKISGMISKIIIESTHKMATFSAQSWLNIIKRLIGIINNAKTTEIESFLMCYILKGSLCCYNKIEQKAFVEKESQGLINEWSNLLVSLLAKSDEGEDSKTKHDSNRVVTIVFLLQTVLKENNFELLLFAFKNISSQKNFSPSSLFSLYFIIVATLLNSSAFLKSCTEILKSILYDSKEMKIDLEELSKPYFKPAFSKLAELFKNLEHGDKVLGLGNILPVTKDEINRELLLQLIENPSLLINPGTSIPMNTNKNINFWMQNLLIMLNSPFTPAQMDSMYKYFINLMEVLKLEVSKNAPNNEIQPTGKPTSSQPIQPADSAAISVQINNIHEYIQNSTNFIYWSMLLHLYATTYKYQIIDKKLCFGGSAEELIKMLNALLNMLMEFIENFIRYYLEFSLNNKINLAAFLQSLFYICKDFSQIIDKLKINEGAACGIISLMSSNVIKDMVTNCDSEVTKMFSLDTQQSHSRAEALTNIINFHLHLKIDPAYPQNLMQKVTLKAMISTLLSIKTIYDIIIHLVNRDELQNSSKINEIRFEVVTSMTKLEEIPFFAYIDAELKTGIIELSKRLFTSHDMMKPEILGAVTIDNLTLGCKALLTMKRIAIIWKDIFAQVQKEASGECNLSAAVEMMLTIWRQHFNTAWDTTSIISQSISPQPVASVFSPLVFIYEVSQKNDIIASINSVCSSITALTTGNLQELFIQTLCNTLEKKNQKVCSVIQAYFSSLIEEQILMLLELKDCSNKECISKFFILLVGDNSAGNLFNEPLATLLFKLTIKAITKLSEDQYSIDLLQEYFKIIDNLMKFKRDQYLSSIISDLVPFATACKNDQIQSLLLTFLSYTCYYGLSISYPTSEVKQHKEETESLEELLEGYGTINFIKKDNAFALANPPKGLSGWKYCTFLKTQKNMEMQAFYSCYTCNMINGKGICSVCAKNCHQGHKVMLHKFVSAYCDCPVDKQCTCISIPKDFDGDLEKLPWQAYKKWSLIKEKGALENLRNAPEEEYSINSGVLEELGIRPPTSYKKVEANLEGPFGAFTSEKPLAIEHFKSLEEDNNEEQEEDMQENNSEDAIFGHDANSVQSMEAVSSNTGKLMPPGAEAMVIPPSPGPSEGGLSGEAENKGALSSSSIPIAGGEGGSGKGSGSTEQKIISYEKQKSCVASTVQLGSKLPQADSRKIESFFYNFCKESLLVKNKEIFNSMNEAILKKSKKIGPNKDILFKSNSKILKSNLAICQAKTVYDIMSGSSKIKPSYGMGGNFFGGSESASSYRSFLQQYPSAKHMMSISPSGLIAVGDKDHLSIYSGQTLNSFDGGKEVNTYSESRDKSKMQPLRKIPLGFLICSVLFNEASENFLAVCGVRNCVIYTFTKKGVEVSKLMVNLMLQDMGEEFTICKAQWIPGSQVHLAVAAFNFIKIYNLAEDNISPIYTINLSEESIRDMAIIRETANESNYRFFVATSSNLIATVVVEVNAEDHDKKMISSDSSIEIVSHLAIKEDAAQKAFKEGQIMAMYYSMKSNLLFLTFDNGKMLYAELDENMDSFKKSVIVTMGEDVSSASKSLIYCLKDVDFTNDYLYLSGLMTGSSQYAIVIRIGEKDAHLFQQKIKADGLGTISAKNQKKIIFCSEDMYISTFVVAGGEQDGGLKYKSKDWVEKYTQIESSGKNYDSVSKMIAKTKLPTTVSIAVDFFEYHTNACENSYSLHNKFKITGSIPLSLGKDNKYLVDWLLKGTGKDTITIPVSKPLPTVEIAIDSQDSLIVGIRVLCDCSGQKNYIHIFNRKVQITPYQNCYTDIAFCEAEMFSVPNNTPITLSFEIDENNPEPVRLRGLEIYCNTKDRLSFYEKMEKLEKKFNVLQGPQQISSAVSDETKYGGILLTKQFKCLNYLDKEKNLDKLNLQYPSIKVLISALDYFTTLSYSCENLQEAKAQELLEILQGFAYAGIEDGIEYLAVRCAARRCSKGIIYNITGNNDKVRGDIYNYHTFKDYACISYINQKLKAGNVIKNNLLLYLKHCEKIMKKRRIIWYDILSKNTDLMLKLQGIMMKGLESNFNNDQNEDLSKDSIRKIVIIYMKLVVSYFDYLMTQLFNANYHVSQDSTTIPPITHPHAILQPSIFTTLAPLITPLIIHRSEYIKGLLLSILPEILIWHDQEFIQTIQKPVIQKYKSNIFSQSGNAGTNQTGAEKMEDMDEETRMAMQMSMGQEVGSNIVLVSWDFSMGLLNLLVDPIMNACGYDGSKANAGLAMIFIIINNYCLNSSALKSVEPLYEESIAQAFKAFIEGCLIKQNVTSSGRQQIILLSLILFNKIFNVPKENKLSLSAQKISEEKKQISTGQAPQKVAIPQFSSRFQFEFSFKLLGAILQNEVLLEWILASLKALCNVLKEKYGASDESAASVEQMQDFSPEKKQFLIVSQKITKESWSFFFSDDDIGKDDTSGTNKIFMGIEKKITQELARMVYLIGMFEGNYLNNASGKPGIKGLNWGILILETGSNAIPPQIVNPKQKQIVKEIKDIACELLITPGVSTLLNCNVHNMFRLLSRSKNEIHEFKDNFVYNINFKLLQELIKKQGADIQKDMPYDIQMNIYRKLNAIWKVACERTSNYKAYIKINEASLALLLNLALTITQEKLLFTVLCLISLALENSEPEDFNIKFTFERLAKDTEKTSEIIEKTKELPTEALSKCASENIPYTDQFMQKALPLCTQLALLSSSIILRAAIIHTIKGLFDSGTEMQKKEVSSLVFKILSQTQFLHTYGSTVLQIFYLALYLFQCNYTDNFDSVLLAATQEAQKAAQLLKLHENGEIYRSLHKLCASNKTKKEIVASGKSFDKYGLSYDYNGRDSPWGSGNSQGNDFAYCLESIPCSICISEISQPSSTVIRLEDNNEREEKKFTETTWVYRLKNAYQINKVIFNIESRGVSSKMLKCINVYMSHSREKDLGDLHKNWSAWKKAGSGSSRGDSSSIIIDFPIPFVSSLLKFEFIPSSQSTSSESNGYDGPKLVRTGKFVAQTGISGRNAYEPPDSPLCPRCHQMLSSYGPCNNCGYGSLECPNCHGLYNNKPDAIICEDCGYTKYWKLDISMSVKMGFATEKIASEKDTLLIQNNIADGMNQSLACHDSIVRMREKMAKIIKQENIVALKPGDASAGGRFIDLHDIYFNSCLPEYFKLVKHVIEVNSMKSEILQYMNQYSVPTECSKLTPSSNCYGCAESFLQIYVKVIDLSAKIAKCSSFYAKKPDLLSVLMNSIYPYSSPQLQKLIVRSVVSLGSYCPFFSGFLMKEVASSVQASVSGEVAKTTLMLTSGNNLLAMELLVGIHSRMNSNYLISGNFAPSSKATFDLICTSYWNHFSIGVSMIKKAPQIGEDILAPLLDYAVQLLAIYSKLDSASSFLINLTQALDGQSPNLKSPTKAKELAYNFANSQLLSCLTTPGSRTIREISMKLIQLLFSIMPASVVPTINTMISLLPYQFTGSQETSDYFFDILKQGINLMEGTGEKRFMLTQLFQQCDKELDRLLIVQSSLKLREDTIGKELWVGYALQRAFEIIQNLSQNKEIQKIFTAVDPEIAYFTISQFMKIKKLLLISNSYIERGHIILSNLTTHLQSENKVERKLLISLCLKLLNEQLNDEQSSIFLYEQLYRQVNLEKPEPAYFVTFSKASSQNDYIPGSLPKSPILLSDIGVLMKDLRAKICKDLEIGSAEGIIELLVGNQIIDPEIPSKLVYEKVWWPYLFRKKNPDMEEIPSIDSAKPGELDPMQVVLRLAGAGDLATEKKIDSLGDSKEAENPEETYAITSIFAESSFTSSTPKKRNSTGIDLILYHLLCVKNLNKQKVIAEKIMKILLILIKTKVNRQKIIQVRGVNIIAAKLIEFLQFYDTQENVKIVDTLILILETIILELNQSSNKSTEMNQAEDPSGIDVGHINKILEKLSLTCEKMITGKENIKKPSKYVVALTRILPYLAIGNSESVSALVKYFTTWLNCEEIEKATDNANKLRYDFHTMRLIEILESSSSLDQRFNEGLILSGTTEKLISYISAKIFLFISNEAELKKCASVLKLALKVLHEICKEHGKTQQLIFSKLGLIENIYKISINKYSDPDAKETSLSCDILIEDFSDSKSPLHNKEVFEYTKSLIQKTKDEKKLLAEKKKAEVMKKMHVKREATCLKPEADQKIFGEAKMEEEKGLKCIVCHEGYGVKPEEILGVYVFGKAYRIRAIDDFSAPFSSVTGFGSVTHFNPIHLSCHLNAAKADKTLKVPKTEWEGATIRNDHTKCNNWLPIRGGNVSEENYVSSISKYFSYCKNIFKTDQGKFKLMCHDLKFLLRKFAYEESFSHYSQGGGPGHNISLIPYMIQLSCYLLISSEGGFSLDASEKIFASFFSAIEALSKQFTPESKIKVQPVEEWKKEDEKREDIKITADDFCYICTLSLLTQGYDQWKILKNKIFPSIILIALDMAQKGVTGKHRGKKVTTEKMIHLTSSAKFPESNIVLSSIMKEIRPILIFMALVEEIKKLQLTLAENNSALVKEELIQKIFVQICKDHTTISKAMNNILENYNKKMLEANSVEELAGLIGIEPSVLAGDNILKNIEKIVEQ